MPSISLTSELRDASMVAIYVERDRSLVAPYNIRHILAVEANTECIFHASRASRVRVACSAFPSASIIGLINSVLQLIVEMQRGCIWVASTTRQGSTFRMMPPVQAIPLDEERQCSRRCSVKRILALGSAGSCAILRDRLWTERLSVSIN